MPVQWSITASECSPEETAQKVLDQIMEWTALLEIPQKLTDFGVKEEDIEEMAIAASNVKRLMNNNPRELSLSEIESVYRKLLA